MTHSLPLGFGRSSLSITSSPYRPQPSSLCPKRRQMPDRMSPPLQALVFQPAWNLAGTRRVSTGKLDVAGRTAEGAGQLQMNMLPRAGRNSRRWLVKGGEIPTNTCQVLQPLDVSQDPHGNLAVVYDTRRDPYPSSRLRFFRLSCQCTILPVVATHHSNASFSYAANHLIQPARRSCCDRNHPVVDRAIIDL